MAQDIVRALSSAGDLLAQLSDVPGCDKEKLESIAIGYLSIIQVQCLRTPCCARSNFCLHACHCNCRPSLQYTKKETHNSMVRVLQDTQDRLLKAAEKLSHLIPDERNTYTSNVQVRLLQDFRYPHHHLCCMADAAARTPDSQDVSPDQQCSLEPGLPLLSCTGAGDQKERLQLLHAARTVKIVWIKSTCVMLLQEYAALLRVQALEQRLAIVRRELKEGLASEKLAAAAPEPMQEA